MLNNNKGFSLIELSIVLIILGLLVAGVTGGASLIKSAKVNKICNQLTEFERIYNSYRAEYNAIPGDGDESVMLDNLQTAGFVGKEQHYFGSGGNYCPSGLENPNEAYGKCNGILFWLSSGYNSIFFAEYQSGVVCLWTANNPERSKVLLDESFARAIDKKIDDGDPGTGSVRTSKNSDGIYSWDSMYLRLDI